MRDQWLTKNLRKATGLGFATLAVLSMAMPLAAQSYQPVQWTEFVKVEGQSEPIPKQWLQDEEARIAHSLKLPDSIPKPVPFDFGWGLGSSRSQSVAYFTIRNSDLAAAKSDAGCMGAQKHHSRMPQPRSTNAYSMRLAGLKGLGRQIDIAQGIAAACNPSSAASSHKGGSV